MSGGIAWCIVGRTCSCGMTIVGIRPPIVLRRAAAVGRPVLVGVHASGRGWQMRSACPGEWVMIMHALVGTLAMS